MAIEISGQYSMQKVFCRVCAVPMETDFANSKTQGADGSCCSPACVKELWWRRTLSVLGKPYRPREVAPVNPDDETKKIKPKAPSPV